MKQVAIGLLGQQLDRKGKRQRWERWRPTVDICRHDDLLIDRLELLVEDKPTQHELAQQVARDIRVISPETEVRMHKVSFKNAWDFEEVYGVLHDFARSYPFDLEKEDYLLHITTGTHVAQICMFLLTESRYFPGRILQASPPRRNQGQPGSYSIIDLDLSRYDRIAARYRQEREESHSFLKSGIPTLNSSFNRMITEVEKVAMHSTEPILLMGPTGAGKSQLAKRVHELKAARGQLNGRFIEVNCATLRGDAALSTLFGHRKGAFTGAANERKGLLREANGGLLFLDEIGELGLDEQALLLHAIEEKKFFPLGSDTEVQSDFQLICGTNRDLNREAADQSFRLDLLERINLWTYHYPGLRERIEDIAPNLDYELERYAGKTGGMVRFSSEARKKFLHFAESDQALWTANFRDLNSAVTRMATLAPGGRITAKTVDDEIARLKKKWTAHHQSTEQPNSILRETLGEAADQIDRFDRAQLADVITVCRAAPTLSEAGRQLFAISRAKRRSTNDADRLRKYLAKFDLTWPQLKKS